MIGRTRLPSRSGVAATNLIALQKTCGKPHDGDFNVPACSLIGDTLQKPE